MIANSHEELLKYYKAELTYLRRMGGVFAERYPKVAKRLEIGHDEAEVLGGVPWCVRRSEADSADNDLGAVAQRIRALHRAGRISPLGVAFGRKVQRRARGCGERVRPGHEVGVHVSLGDVGYPDSLGSGRASVLRDIEIRVDDYRLARLFTGDHVARLGQIVVVESLEEHPMSGACLRKRCWMNGQ